MMRPGHSYFRTLPVKHNKTLTNGGSTCLSWRENTFDESDDESDVSSLSTSSDDSDAESCISRSGTRRGLVVETSGRHTEHSNTNTDASMDPNRPPTPWGKSSAKSRIIVELNDPTSDIHLYLGQYTENDFKNVNFRKILEEYAGNNYKLNLFRENMKRILVHLQKRTGPFDQNKTTVEKWYTSANNVSKAYSLLFALYMDEAAYRSLARMSTKEIWQSDPIFQQYEFEKFKDYLKNMANRTEARKKQIKDEYQAYLSDMRKLPASDKTSRGYPFWDTHKASELLEEDEESGKAKELKPKELWKSRLEYQDFPLHVFRKHIYQLRYKRLATPFWQYKRNKNARTKYEETENLLKEWQYNMLPREFIGVSL
jgi:hypothetical protein